MLRLVSKSEGRKAEGRKAEGRTSTFWLEGTVLGVRVRRNTGIPARAEYRARAEQERVKVESEIVLGGGGKAQGETKLLEVAAREYLDWKRLEGRLSDATVKHVFWWTEKEGKTEVGRINGPTVRGWTLKYLSGVKPGTAKRRLTTLRAILGSAVKNGDLKGVPPLSMPRVQDERDEHWTAEEVGTFLDAVREHQSLPIRRYYGLFCVLALAGPRVGEAVRLEARDFITESDGSRWVRVRRPMGTGGTKTVARMVPMHRRIADWIDEGGMAPLGDGRVFYGADRVWRDGAPASAALRYAMEKVCKEIGLRTIRVHDLRHTFAYLMAEAGADLGDLQRLMGHANIAMTMRYRGFVKSRAMDAMGRVAV